MVRTLWCLHVDLDADTNVDTDEDTNCTGYSAPNEDLNGEGTHNAGTGRTRRRYSL